MHQRLYGAEKSSSLNLAQRTLSGIFWAYASFIGGRLLNVVTTAILARLLFPEDFGLIGFATLLISFIEVSYGLGINDALVYTSERVDDAASTTFWINIAVGAVQTTFLFLAAPLTLKFFEDPRIVDVVRVMSLTFVVSSFGFTHDALLQKELEFKRRFIPDLISSFIKGTASIVMALSGVGVWSLVIGHLIGTVARVIAKWWVMRWVPQFRFYTDRAKELWGYGVHILLFELLNVVLEQADQLLIGTMLGALQLGYYAIAAKIPEMVIANFSLILTRVIFPTFAKMKDDLDQLTRGFLMTTKYTAFVTIPAGFGLAAVAPEVIRVIYGSKWDDSIIIMQVLALLGMTATLPWSAGDVLKAVGRPDVSTKLLVIESLYTFPLIYLFVTQQRLAVSASLANLVALNITTVLRLYVISRFLEISPLVFVRVFRSSLFGGVSVFVMVSFWRMLLEGLPLLVILITSILLGAVVYAIIMWMLEREDILQMRETLTATLRRKRDDSDDDSESQSGDETPGEIEKTVLPSASSTAEL
ncbi:MAG TPA: lipopolysaccharide biosynthesis protein [Aggregatilineales bacterium]|nr:lipopolysaccharide biosynthesis protein [Aggregatilineales bacterium]